MKKLLPVVVCVVVLMLALPTLAFASHGASHHGWRNVAVGGEDVAQSISRGHHGGTSHNSCPRAGACFLDENGDGLCDYQPSAVCADEDRNGICDNAENGICPIDGEHCSQFVDKDGDGVCDYHHDSDCAHVSRADSKSNASTVGKNGGFSSEGSCYGYGCCR